MSHCRAQLYRDFWDIAYRTARVEKSNWDNFQQISPMYMVKYTLKAVKTYVGMNAVGLNDAIKMVEKAIELTDTCYSETIPTALELRRLELANPSDFDNGLPF